jgi:hypothetical protein
MRRLCLLAVVMVLLAGPAWGQQAQGQPAIQLQGGQPVGGPGLLCRAAIAAAERANAVPPHLMAAIGRIESGRRDPATGLSHPWPWTVNAEGEGFFYDTKAQAVAAVRDMRARGMRSIDVGCMQINLMHHPDAFASLEEAFDPARNAAYAARFLTQLYAQTGTWPKATAMYHSATPDIGADYQRRVMAVLPEEQQLAGGGAAGSPLAAAWAATLGAGAGGVARQPPMGPPPLGAIQTARTAAGGWGAGGMGAARTAAVMPVPGGGGHPTPGRSLDAYRAAPVALAFRPVRRSG